MIQTDEIKTDVLDRTYFMNEKMGNWYKMSSE